MESADCRCNLIAQSPRIPARSPISGLQYEKSRLVRDHARRPQWTLDPGQVLEYVVLGRECPPPVFGESNLRDGQWGLVLDQQNREPIRMCRRRDRHMGPLDPGVTQQIEERRRQ